MPNKTLGNVNYVTTIVKLVTVILNTLVILVMLVTSYKLKMISLLLVETHVCQVTMLMPNQDIVSNVTVTVLPVSEEMLTNVIVVTQ